MDLQQPRKFRLTFGKAVDSRQRRFLTLQDPDTKPNDSQDDAIALADGRADLPEDPL